MQKEVGVCSKSNTAGNKRKKSMYSKSIPESGLVVTHSFLNRILCFCQPHIIIEDNIITKIYGILEEKLVGKEVGK